MIHSASGTLIGMVAAMAANVFEYWRRMATATMMPIETRTGRTRCQSMVMGQHNFQRGLAAGPDRKGGPKPEAGPARLAQRRGRDSNPRRLLHRTRFPSERTKPLCDLSTT